MLIPRMVVNLLSEDIELQDVLAVNGNVIHLLPGIPVDLLSLAIDDDLAKSYHLKHLQDTGSISVTSTFDTGAVSASNITSWVLSNDAYVQFSPINGPSTDNAYSASHTVGANTSLVITNGVGIVDTLNNISTVQVSVTGGSATSPLLNSHASPITVTFVNGSASINVKASSAGTVLLGLASPTHPSVILTASDTATVTLS